MGVSAGPGSLVGGRYRLEAPLGEGGFGAVFRATDLTEGRVVALKILLRDVVDMGPRFRREAELAMRLSHPNTVRTLDAGEDQALGPYIVLELLEGQSLDAMLRTRGAMEPRRAAAVVGSVLASLEEAHAQGIIHRDIKPANVFLVQGPVPTVKVLDFGIAKSTNANTQAGLTRAGQTVGTPAYMAPEQVSGTPLGPETDLYAVGLLLAEVLTGRPVYEGQEPMTVLIDKLNGAPVPLPASLRGSPLEPIATRAVAHHREARWRSAAQMRRALEQAAAAMPDETFQPGALRVLAQVQATGWDAEGSSAPPRGQAVDSTIGAIPIPAPLAQSVPPTFVPPTFAPPTFVPPTFVPPTFVPAASWEHTGSSPPAWSQPPWAGSMGPPLAMAPPHPGEQRSSGLGVGCLLGGAIFMGLVVVAAGAGAVLFGLAEAPRVSKGPPAPAAPLAAPAPAGEPTPVPVPHATHAVACPRLQGLDPRTLNASIHRSGFGVGDQSETHDAETMFAFGLTQSGIDVGALVFYEGAAPTDNLAALGGAAETTVTYAMAGRRLLFVTMEGSPAALFATICGGGATTPGGSP